MLLDWSLFLLALQNFLVSGGKPYIVVSSSFVDFSIPKKQNSLPEDRFWLQADGKYEEHGECGLDGKSW